MGDICRDLLPQPFPLPNPFDPDVILNPNWVPDPECIKSGFTINIFVGDTPYDFTCYYIPPTMEMVENRGFERGTAKFRICDYSPNSFCLPFLPRSGQKIEIWNQNMTDKFFTGRVTAVLPELIVRRCDGTEVAFYDIDCVDRTQDMERILVSEHYTNVKTGFIVRDLFRRYACWFDYTTIDPTIGQTVTDLRFNNVYLSQAVQRILDLEPTWTFWFDAQTTGVYVGETTAIYNTITVATESTVYDLFDSDQFKFSTDTSVIRNKVKFIYNTKYSTGTVSVARGDVVVSGQGTQFTRFMAEGAEIRIDNETDTYTVEKVLSDLELRISSPYQGTIKTMVPFEMTGVRGAIVVSDPQSIAFWAALNDESCGNVSGVYEYLVPNDGNAYTRDEAYQIAKAALLRFVEPLISGSARTDNVKFPFAGIRAGQVIRFELPISRQVIADVVIQTVTRKDLGPLLCRPDFVPSDPRIDPMLELNFDFQDRVFDIRNQIKRVMADVRRLGAGDTDIIEDVYDWSEQVFVDDCVQIIPPIPINDELEISDDFTLIPPTTFTEELEISDNFIMTLPPAGPYYTTPTPRQAGYCIGATKFGFTS